MVRCKFQLSEITEVTWSATGRRYKFTPQYDSSIPEDVRFAKSSPSGAFEIFVDNPPAQEQFKLGGFYYFDATPVPTVEAK